ncbi:MAG: DNA repair protein RecO [Prevotella sp.]
MLINTRAVVLHTLKYGDSQVITDMLTESHGRLSFIQRVPKTSRARVKKQLLQPMTMLNIVFDYRPNVGMLRLKEASLTTPFASIPFDMRKLTIALFLAEFIIYTTREEQHNESLFRYIANSVMWLDACQRRCPNFHLVFMLRLSRFVGFFPNIDEGAPGDYFDLRNGCFTSAAPLHGDFLPPAEAGKIRTLMRMNYDNMHLFTFSHNERNRCTDIILKYYRLHLPGFPEPKSLAVLHDVFS